MTEKEYVIVSDLQRCQTAARLLRATSPACNPYIEQKELVDVVKTIERWTDKMYDAAIQLVANTESCTFTNGV